jgi:hypothetical protein
VKVEAVVWDVSEVEIGIVWVILLRLDAGLDVGLSLGPRNCLSRRPFSSLSIQPSSFTGSRMVHLVYRPVRTEARIRDGSWLTFE